MKNLSSMGALSNSAYGSRRMKVRSKFAGGSTALKFRDLFAGKVKASRDVEGLWQPTAFDPPPAGAAVNPRVSEEFAEGYEVGHRWSGSARRRAT